MPTRRPFLEAWPNASEKPGIGADRVYRVFVGDDPGCDLLKMAGTQSAFSETLIPKVKVALGGDEHERAILRDLVGVAAERIAEPRSAGAI